MAVLAHATRVGLDFDVRIDGPADGEPVLLLHGFPQHSDSWDAVVPLLTEQGYRTLAMDQRGYSPRARPHGRRAYRMPELAADAAAVIDQLAGGRAHVVGHDWGAGVAWALAAGYPDKVRSLTAVSVPHPMAFLKAMATSVQGLKSWYMYLFQLPWLPERLLARGYVRMLSGSFGQAEDIARRDAAGFAGPAAFNGPLNYYRAIPLIDPRSAGEPVRSPTLFVWSDGDAAITRRAADNCADYVAGPYRFETLRGVSHWIPDEAPAELAALLLPHLKEWSGR
jgi:pimeloyl-ACP methyl ester carboxylesterase